MSAETKLENIENLPDFSLSVKDQGIIIGETEEVGHLKKDEIEPNVVVDDARDKEDSDYKTDSEDTDY